MKIKLLKAEAVAELLNVPIHRVWELSRNNKIPAIKIGKRLYRYNEAELMKWIENGGNWEG